MFCVSQASTAICSAMDEPSSSSASSQLGGRAIDRFNPIIRDGKRAVPCSSQPPISPVSYHQLQKLKKESKPSHVSTITISSVKQHEQKRKSGSKPHAKLADFIKTGLLTSSSSPRNHVVNPRKSCSKKGVDTGTPGSSRYLLGDSTLSDSALVSVGNKEDSGTYATAKEESPSLLSKRSPLNQIVVLRVSLHCRGCEGKVRKHLSRMEGVRCFNIDFAAKKVTVEGDVTPVSVLASISKVKNAQFWTTGLASVTPANPNLTIIDPKKQ